jgi:hypothetical protein
MSLRFQSRQAVLPVDDLVSSRGRFGSLDSFGPPREITGAETLKGMSLPVTDNLPMKASQSPAASGIQPNQKRARVQQNPRTVLDSVKYPVPLVLEDYKSAGLSEFKHIQTRIQLFYDSPTQFINRLVLLYQQGKRFAFLGMERQHDHGGRMPRSVWLPGAKVARCEITNLWLDFSVISCQSASHLKGMDMCIDKTTATKPKKNK